MKRRLIQSFKELFILLIKVFFMCLAYTVGMCIAIILLAAFSVYTATFLYWLIPFIPFELWICVCMIFGIMFGVFIIEELRIKYE